MAPNLLHPFLLNKKLSVKILIQTLSDKITQTTRLIYFCRNNLRNMGTNKYKNAPFSIFILLSMAVQSNADCQLQTGRKIFCENLASLPSSYPSENATHLEFAMHGNNIENITAGAFVGMKDLKLIKLSRGGVKNIDPEAFKGLDELETLNLGDNKIKEIKTGTFLVLPKLRILRLETNMLSSLPKNALPASLESLELDYNGFTEVPLDAIEGLAKFETLKMNNNKLTSLPVLSGIKTLKNVEVTENKLTTVEPKIFDGLKLKEVMMNSNPFICDCNLTGFFQWIKGYEFERDAFKPDFSEYECDSTSPESLGSKTFDMFNITAFQSLNCTIPTPATPGSGVVNVSGKGGVYGLVSSSFLCIVFVIISFLLKI